MKYICEVNHTSHPFSGPVELADLQAILHSLPDEVQIEYKIKVEEALKEKEKKERRREERQGPGRKVHVKSADQATRGNRKVVEDKPPRQVDSSKVRKTVADTCIIYTNKIIDKAARLLQREDLEMSAFNFFFFK